jgi:nucleoid-associated protein YgaU
VWGKGDFPGSHFENSMVASQKRQNGFDCVVESVRQRFTLFSTNGVPLRATLSVALREYKTLDKQLQELNLLSPDHTKIHIFQQGETLARLAAGAYDDPAQWRHIADENNIDDPLNISPGTVLRIPPLFERT